ncbi:MAG: hypothetical protein HC880_06695 [Bacteroidia bacterium]|nr:hypothetical protein [Bacteroidia bacterium]
MYHLSPVDPDNPNSRPVELTVDEFLFLYSIEEIQSKIETYEEALKDKDIDFSSHPILKNTKITNEYVCNFLKTFVKELKQAL